MLLATGGLPGARLALYAASRTAPTAPDDRRVGRAVVTVRDGANGPPLAGAQVRALAMVDDRSYLVGQESTDGEGRASLSALPAVEVWILVEAPGRARGAVHFAADAFAVAGEPRAVAIALLPQHQLDVVVHDEEERPVADAEIEVVARGEGLPVGARSGDDGTAHVERLSEGPFAVTVRAQGYEEEAVDGAAEGRAQAVTLHRLGALVVRAVASHDEPVAGAHVMMAGAALWPARVSEADERGEVRVRGLSAGSYAVRATSGDLVSPIEIGVSLARGEEKTVVLHLTQGRWVGVRVTDGDSDDAVGIPLARVTLAESGLSPFPFEAITDAKGKARLGPVAPGVASLDAHAEGFVSQGSAPLPDVPPPETRLVLLRAGALSGRVVDSDGAPIAGAVLEVVGNQPSGSPIFDDPRRASFQAAQFDHTLRGPGSWVGSGELGVVPGPVPPIPLGGSGLPVAALTAAPSFGPSDPPAAHAEPWTSRGDGSFRLAPASPGRVRVVVRHPRFVDAESEVVTLTPGGEVRVDVVMLRGGTLEGRVVDANDRAVEGARVTAAAVRGALQRATRSAADGSFELAALPEEVSLTAGEADDEQPEVRLTVAIPEGGRSQVTLHLPERRGPVALAVVDDRGWAVPNAQISATSLVADVPLRATAFTDANGEATLQRARGLPVRLEVSAPGFAPRQVTADGSADSVRVELRPAVNATGEVVDGRSGDPVEGAEIVLSTSAGARRARTDRQGTYSLSDLASERATLRVRAPGFAAAERVLTIAEGSGLRALSLPRVELEAEGVVEGEVVDGQGDPVVGARVAKNHASTWLAVGASAETAAVTDAKGHFSLRELDEGTATLEAYAPDVGRGRLEGVRIFSGQTTYGARIVLAPTPDGDRARPKVAAGGVAVTLGETAAPVQVVVVAVASGSEAERAGLAPGDVLLAVDDVAVGTMKEARERLSGSLSDDVVVRVQRADGQAVLRVVREPVRR